MGMPLRRLLRSKQSNISAASVDSHDVRLYNQLGRGNDFEARVETNVDDDWVQQPEATKQKILVTQSFTAQSK